MKKFFLILLLIIITLSFTACAEITISTVIDEGGGRTRGYTITLDKSLAGDIYASACDKITRLLTDYQKDEEARGGETTLTIDTENGVFDLQVYYPTVTDYYASIGLSGYEENQPYEVYKEDAFFVDYYAESPIINQQTVDTYKEGFKEFIKDENNPFEGIKVQFLYGTAYSNIYSTNAKESYTEDGYNYMVWDLDLENPDNVIPVLISHSPKVWVFEVIGISIGLLAVGIVLTIFILKKKKRTIVEK